MDKTQKASKKKSTKFFENYILKLMSSSHNDKNITSDSRQQLNSVLCHISKLVGKEARDMANFCNKKTVSIEEIETAISSVFPKVIAIKMCVAGVIANTAFLTSETQHDKTVSKQVKAGISVSPALVDKFIRDFGNSKIQVTASAPVYFAGAMEELIMHILNISVKTANANKHVRITVRDIEVSIKEDPDLSSFFHKQRIIFIGGGNIPYIHDSLLAKRPRKRPNQPRANKTHRFRPGTVSIREIKKAQNSHNYLIFAKSTFEQIIRDKISKELGNPENGIMIRKDVFPIIQFFIEQKIVELLRYANCAAIHANRLKVIPEDIDFVNSLFTGVIQNTIDNGETETEDDFEEVLGEEEVEVVGEEEEVVGEEEEVIGEKEEEDDSSYNSAKEY